jgi:hypothetical protein
MRFPRSLRIIVMPKHSILFITTFVRFHRTLRVTPAMQAGITDTWMEMEDIARLVESEYDESITQFSLFLDANKFENSNRVTTGLWV